MLCLVGGAVVTVACGEAVMYNYLWYGVLIYALVFCGTVMYTNLRYDKLSGVQQPVLLVCSVVHSNLWYGVLSDNVAHSNLWYSGMYQVVFCEVVFNNVQSDNALPTMM